MRELLLEYGATNTRELQQDWRRSKAAIENDAAWLEKYHGDFSSWSSLLADS